MATGMVQAKPEGSGTYTYSSQPRAVQQDKKYRDQSAYGNIMYDRRIVRGNTYALHTLPASSQPDPLELQRQQESRRRALARKRAREQFKPRSPEPVEGRKHIEVQTELYLEEITDRVEEADVQTQTDAFLDRPSTPLFVPAKTGMDAATQIEEGDLFDFDIEVRPILEVLVGKTVEQALLEVMEEEELASLRAQQRVFEENRNAEFVETQRLEEQERRHREEKERRMQQQREALLKEKETAEKIAARAFAQSYLADLVPSVFSTLNQNGFFYDPVEREVETVFMPYLMEETEKALNKRLVARTLLDAIIRNMVASKFGIEISDPEPAPPPTTQEEPSPSGDQQADQKDLPKVFGDEETKESQPSPAEAKEGEGESDPSTVETSKAEEGPAETEKTDTVKEEQPVDVKPGDSEGAEPPPVDSKEKESKDSVPVEKEGGDGEQPVAESRDSEVAEESKTTTDDTPEAVAAVTEEEPGTQSEETADKQEETVVSDENKTDGEPSTGETVPDEPTKTEQEEPADPPTTEEQS